MDQCDASRVAEIEKAVVEQAHCYLSPRGDGFRVPMRTDPADVVLLGCVGLMVFILGLVVGGVFTEWVGRGRINAKRSK